MEDYKTLYEQRLERAKEEIKKCGYNKGRIRMIENIFPELKESEDERIRRDIIRYLKKTSPAIGENIEKMLVWLEKQGKQKPTWSEEDEKMLNFLIDVLLGTPLARFIPIRREIIITWLESLKERVQPQPKQEWSEEDETACSNTIIMIKEGAANHYMKDSINLVITWLKSLKERYSWKPSDEQMKLLREVQQALLGKDCHNRFVNFMYELKRLREE